MKYTLEYEGLHNTSSENRRRYFILKQTINIIGRISKEEILSYQKELKFTHQQTIDYLVLHKMGYDYDTLNKYIDFVNGKKNIGNNIADFIFYHSEVIVF